MSDGLISVAGTLLDNLQRSLVQTSQSLWTYLQEAVEQGLSLIADIGPMMAKEAVKMFSMMAKAAAKVCGLEIGIPSCLIGPETGCTVDNEEVEPLWQSDIMLLTVRHISRGSCAGEVSTRK